MLLLETAVPPFTLVWFLLVAVLWIGYFFLECFDYGVAMLIKILGRDDKEKRVIVNTIGPLWDGNGYGCSPPVARCSPPSRAGTRRCSPVCTCRCYSCCSA